LNLPELSFQCRKAHKEANELLDTAVLESRSMTVAEQVRFDGLLAKMSDLKAQIAQRESLRKRVI
jgi:hypothetical protein